VQEKREPVRQPSHPPTRCRQCASRTGKPQSKPAEKQGIGISTFLKQILPKDFDTGDLFVILLLLLMAGESADDQNTALLTLALYFFL